MAPPSPTDPADAQQVHTTDTAMGDTDIDAPTMMTPGSSSSDDVIDWTTANPALSYERHHPLYPILDAIRSLQDGQKDIVEAITQQGQVINGINQKQADLEREMKHLKGETAAPPGPGKSLGPKGWEATCRALQGSIRLLTEQQGTHKKAIGDMAQAVSEMALAMNDVTGTDGGMLQVQSAAIDELRVRQENFENKTKEALARTGGRGDSDEMRDSWVTLARVMEQDGNSGRVFLQQLVEILFAQNALKDNMDAIWTILKHAEDVPGSPITGVRNFRGPIKNNIGAKNYWKGSLVAAIAASGPSRLVSATNQAFKRQITDYTLAPESQAFEDPQFQFVRAFPQSMAFVEDTIKLVNKFCQNLDLRQNTLRRFVQPNRVDESLNRLGGRKRPAEDSLKKEESSVKRRTADDSFKDWPSIMRRAASEEGEIVESSDRVSRRSTTDKLNQIHPPTAPRAAPDYYPRHPYRARDDYRPEYRRGPPDAPRRRGFDPRRGC